jgi:hypothetical protein
VRQVLGAIAEFDKSMLVSKLAAGHTRKRKAKVLKVKGRKSLAETRPEVMALAKGLMRKKPKVGQMSLRAISAELAGLGRVDERGSPLNQGSIAAMSGKERGMASTINLTGNELAAVPAAIRGVVEADRHPLSPRLNSLRAALARLGAAAGSESIPRSRTLRRRRARSGRVGPETFERVVLIVSAVRS